MPASNEVVEVVTDDHLYTIAELYEKFGKHIPPYRWYLTHGLLNKGHIFTIYFIEPNGLGKNLFNVGLTIIDWVVNPTRSIETNTLRVGTEPVLVDIGDPPQYKVHSTIVMRHL